MIETASVPQGHPWPESRDLGRVRYIGSKARVVDAIMSVVGRPGDEDGFLIDAFCGTGVVGSKAADLGWRVRFNDNLQSAAAMARAEALSTSDVPFQELGGYDSVIRQLNTAPPVRGFFWREYSPASDSGRMYFTEKNAASIDASRLLLRRWIDSDLVTLQERHLLVADLIRAAGRVANIAGTYGCFLSYWTPSSRRPFSLSPRRLRDYPVEHEVLSRDVADVPMAETDVAYLDPPYTKRQYAAYYHVNETLAHGDEPVVGGKTGLRRWQDRASDYCYKRRALDTLTGLITSASARRIYLSYSSEGHVPMDRLNRALRELGDVETHELAPVGRYRPNRVASSRGHEVTEYLIELRKSEVVRPALTGAA